jgi:hypothetical protein
MCINFTLLLYCPFIFFMERWWASVPACEGVEAGLPQGEAAGVLLLLGLRLPLLNINKLFEIFMSFSFHCWVTASASQHQQIVWDFHVIFISLLGYGFRFSITTNCFRHSCHFHFIAGLRLPLLNINKLFETIMSFSFYCWLQFRMQLLLHRCIQYFFVIKVRYFFLRII